jgi:hypothetical protein
MSMEGHRPHSSWLSSTVLAAAFCQKLGSSSTPRPQPGAEATAVIVRSNA